jgi:hypothetical protein
MAGWMADAMVRTRSSTVYDTLRPRQQYAVRVVMMLLRAAAAAAGVLLYFHRPLAGSRLLRCPARRSASMQQAATGGTVVRTTNTRAV